MGIIVIIFYFFYFMWQKYFSVLTYQIIVFRRTSRSFYLRVPDQHCWPSRSYYCHFDWICLLPTFLLPT